MSTNRIIQVKKCDLCNKEIAVTSVKRHMRGVHKQKIGKIIYCEDCRNIYQITASLNNTSFHIVLNQTFPKTCHVMLASTKPLMKTI